MKILFIILTLLTWTCITSCDNKDSRDIDLTQALKVDSVKFVQQDSVITAQVELLDKIDTIKLPSYCGIGCVTMLFHFKVVKIIKGRYDLATIPILVLGPREKIEYKHIENGKVYTYNLKRPRIGQEVYCVFTYDNLFYYITDNLPLGKTR